MDEKILLIVFGIYVIGFCIAVYLSRDEIGKEYTDWIYCETRNKTISDICLVAMLWPAYLFAVLLIGPWLMLAKLIVKIFGKKHK